MALRYLVGLGNPGQEYEYSRHNIGFRVIDELVRRHAVSPWTAGRSAWIAKAEIGDASVRLVLPRTYMNRVGQAVMDLCEKLDAEVEEILVVVDDIDLDLGRLRLRKSGGPGTHNGLRSISQAVGDGYPRLRVGVKGVAPWADLAGFVLADFTDDEVGTVLEASRRAAQAVQSAVCDGLERSMSLFNRPA